MSLKLFLLLIVSLAMLSSLGCTSEQESYEKGRAAGLEKGKRIGYEQGYKKGLAEGFEKFNPGTHSGLSGYGKVVYKIIVWGGAFKLFLSLGFAAFVILSESTSSREGLGKALFGVLGSAFSIIAVTYLHISGIAEDTLLAAAPTSLWWQILCTFGFAIIMYGLLEALTRFIDSSHSSIIEGWAMFVLASLMTVIGPLLWSLFGEVPDISMYFAANVLAGVFFGGIYWIAYGLLSKKFDNLTAKLNEKA